MNKRIKITSARKGSVVYENNGKAPFWLEHLLALIVIGIVVVVGGIIALALTDWGRAAMGWIGLAFGIAITVFLAIAPVKSFRAGERTNVWIGETLAAIGWGGMAIALAAGLPVAFSGGFNDDSSWGFIIPGGGAILGTGIAGLGMWLMTRGPLPALDRTPRTAKVMFNVDDAEGGQDITVRYLGADGEEHDADLADVIDDDWENRFTPGTTWQIYAFRDPTLVASVVFLTEQHDDVWRKGYNLGGVRLGGESGPVTRGPGSPFLREGSRWTFEH
jgi:hypothetical protein